MELPWRSRCSQGSNFKTTTLLALVLKWNFLLISGHVPMYPVFFSALMKDGHIFIRMFGRRIGKGDIVEKNIVIMVYIEVRLRSMIFLRTLMQTNWQQIVLLSGLVSGVMSFTNTIKKQPQEKERQKNCIRFEEILRICVFDFSLANKAFLTRAHRESYDFNIFFCHPQLVRAQKSHF